MANFFEIGHEKSNLATLIYQTHQTTKRKHNSTPPGVGEVREHSQSQLKLCASIETSVTEAKNLIPLSAN